ncbi:MAG: DNA repair protein RecO [Lachnospiraceae bacterium]|nr:DNA repair protein RecO [Lachnospiraceae bacterium]
MADYSTGPVTLTGMILSSSPVSESDRRVVILTKERGKITAFAKGARRQSSRLLASTECFCFGSFKMFEGRSAYNLIDAGVTHYFEELRRDFDGACLGMYFLEFADYYTRENNDETAMLKLLFQSIRAICAKGLDNRLVKVIYEMKALVVNGEFPGIPADRKLSDSAVYAINFIVNTPVEKLYTFAVNDSVLLELTEVADTYRRRFIDRKFKSLDFLGTLGV